MIFRTVKYLAPLLTVILAGACLKLEKGLEKEKKRVITEKANLPPSPSFVQRNLAEKYPDGTYSVEGVVKNVKELSDKAVQVPRSRQRCSAFRNAPRKLRSAIRRRTSTLLTTSRIRGRNSSLWVPERRSKVMNRSIPTPSPANWRTGRPT